MNTNNGVKLANNDIEFIQCEIKARLNKHKVISCLKKTDNDPEVKEVIEYLKKNGISVFPYNFKNKYSKNDIDAHKDKKTGLIYINHGNKNIYMKRSYKSLFRAKRYYSNLLAEQDINSPHRYLTEYFKPDENTVVLDIGGAEGIFSSMTIDSVKKIYVFECDKNWIEAMKNTFKDYGGKLEIIERFVDKYTDDTHITIDDFIKNNNLQDEKLFIKIDAEGSEPDIIEGAASSLKTNPDISIALCVYHCAEHEVYFKNKFSDRKIETSEGYMLYYYDFNWREPYIRRGVLRVFPKTT